MIASASADDKIMQEWILILIWAGPSAMRVFGSPLWSRGAPDILRQLNRQMQHIQRLFSSCITGSACAAAVFSHAAYMQGCCSCGCCCRILEKGHNTITRFEARRPGKQESHMVCMHGHVCRGTCHPIQNDVHCYWVKEVRHS